MQICFITSRNIKAHANMKRAFGMSKQLVSRGHRAAILLEDHVANRGFADNFPGVEYLYFPPAGAVAEARAKSRIIDQRGDDVLVTCGMSVRNHVRIPHRSNRLSLLDHPEVVSSFTDRHPLRRAFEYALEWRAMFGFDGHLAVSRYLEKRLSARLKKLRRPSHVLYSPFAADDEFRPCEQGGDEQGARETAARYAKPMILFIGTFYKAYGFYEMLEAARLTRQVREDFALVLAGAGPELERGKQFVQRHDLEEHVFFPGFLSDAPLRDHLFAAYAFICPLNDTMRDWARSPGKLYMYAATRRPVITSRIGEAIEVLGENGYYYQQGCVESLAAQISKVLDHGSDPVADVSVEGLFWDERTDRFLEWLHKEFGYA